MHSRLSGPQHGKLLRSSKGRAEEPALEASAEGDHLRNELAEVAATKKASLEALGFEVSPRAG